jgi:molecular chaperone DnaK
MPLQEEKGLQKCLGIDFGMNSTVIAGHNGDEKKISMVEFPGWSRHFPLDGENTHVPVTPSLIHYNNGSILIGEQVFSQNCSDSPATARWMKQYILQNNPAQFPAGGERVIGFRQAATDFLLSLLTRASGFDQKNLFRTCEPVMTFPVDAPLYYISWLEETALSAGFRTFHLIDEAYAAARGYGLNVRDGCTVLIIDFGQDVLDVKIVAITEDPPNPTQSRSRVIGRAGDNFGGLAIDTCILQYIRKRESWRKNNTMMEGMNSEMLWAISRMKENLSQSAESSVHFTDPISGRDIGGHLGRDDLDRIFNEQGISEMLNRTLDRALAAARMRGCEEDRIDAVLMTGECANLPPVKEAVIRRFGNKRVLHEHPVDAVARGAALYTPVTPFLNRIRNDYALRYWDPAGNEHRYRFLVRNGAPYPSSGQVARIIISASYDSQTRMGIPIYEITRSDSNSHQCVLELVSDSGGGIRIAGSALDTGVAGKPIRVNERTPMILVAAPPAQKSEPRFELTFTIDRKKNLCVTVRDIITGLLIKTEAPLVRMT